jgi:hypothetical protein
MNGSERAEKVDWQEQWRILFPLTVFTHACWTAHFGVDINIVDYVWETYHEVCLLRHPSHLLLILYFLKVYPTGEVIAAKFGISIASAFRIIWDGLERLAYHLQEVRPFFSQFAESL